MGRSVKEAAAAGAEKALVGPIQGNHRPHRGIPSLGQLEALNPEGKLRPVIIHNGLHQADGDPLIRDGQHLPGILRRLRLRNHGGQAAPFRLVLDLLRGLVSCLGGVGPPGVQPRPCEQQHGGNHGGDQQDLQVSRLRFSALGIPGNGFKFRFLNILGIDKRQSDHRFSALHMAIPSRSK